MSMIGIAGLGILYNVATTLSSILNLVNFSRGLWGNMNRVA